MADIQTTSKLAGRGFLFYLKFSLISIFVIYLIFHAVSLGLRNNDIKITILELGKEFISPISNAQATSVQIVNKEVGIIGYFTLYYYLFLLYSWISVFAFLCRKLVMMDDSRVTNSYIGGVVFFTLFQLIYLALTKQDLNIIWMAWKDIFRALLTILKDPNLDFNFSNFFSYNNSCVGSTCVY